MAAPFVWFDLTAADGAKARDFYEQLLGWSFVAGAGDYLSWMSDGEAPWAGIVVGGATPAGRWVPYVTVDDLDAAAKRATELGGSIVREALAGPAGTSVIVADPNGALVALFTPGAS
jgi:predicted enzyme related to lactoylglutathione lyase